METRLQPRALVDLMALKQNLRIDPNVDVFDQDLASKLSAAIAFAESFINRDLSRVPVISYPYARVTEIDLDPALHIVGVSVGGEEIQPSGWSYADKKLLIYGTGYDDTDVVTVETEWRHDIAVSVLMHASSLWLNPTDSVETLPKASRNLLSQYRTYAR